MRPITTVINKTGKGLVYGLESRYAVGKGSYPLFFYLRPFFLLRLFHIAAQRSHKRIIGALVA